VGGGKLRKGESGALTGTQSNSLENRGTRDGEPQKQALEIWKERSDEGGRSGGKKAGDSLTPKQDGKEKKEHHGKEKRKTYTGRGGKHGREAM